MAAAFDAMAARALATAYSTFGRAATYVPPGGGAGVACMAIVNRPDDVASLENIPLVAAQRLVEVRKSELPAPARGGVFTIDAAQMKIVSAPRVEDPDGLVWSMICSPT